MSQFQHALICSALTGSAVLLFMSVCMYAIGQFEYCERSSKQSTLLHILEGAVPARAYVWI